MRRSVLLKLSDIQLLTRYAHWIPCFRGYTKIMMDENFPGFEWNDLYPKLLKLEILKYKKDIVKKGDLPEGYELIPGELYFLKGIAAIEVIKTERKIEFRVIYKVMSLKE